MLALFIIIWVVLIVAAVAGLVLCVNGFIEGETAKGILGIVIIVAMVAGMIPMGILAKWDPESGQNSGYISAVDKDYWGNYKVYFRDTEQGGGETYTYYIKKSDENLVTQARDAMMKSDRVVVRYESLTEFTTLGGSPIVEITIPER